MQAQIDHNPEPDGEVKTGTPMDELRKMMGIITTGIGLIAGIAGLIGAWVILPYKVEAMGSRVTSNEQVIRMNSEMFASLNATVKAMNDNMADIRKEIRLIARPAGRE